MALEAAKSQVRFQILPIFVVGKGEQFVIPENLPASYRSADEPLARPGRKQANVSVKMS